MRRFAPRCAVGRDKRRVCPCKKKRIPPDGIRFFIFWVGAGKRGDSGRPVGKWALSFHPHQSQHFCGIGSFVIDQPRMVQLTVQEFLQTALLSAKQGLPLNERLLP